MKSLFGLRKEKVGHLIDKMKKKQCSQFLYPFVSGKEKTLHPTQKPISLMGDIIKIHTNINDIVLDCFMGSGSTGVACI